MSSISASAKETRPRNSADLCDVVACCSRHQTSMTTGITIGRRWVRLRKKPPQLHAQALARERRGRSCSSGGRVSTISASSRAGVVHEVAAVAALVHEAARHDLGRRLAGVPSACRARPRAPRCRPTTGGGGRAPPPPRAPSTPERSRRMRPAGTRASLRAPSPDRRPARSPSSTRSTWSAGMPACTARRACWASMRYSPWIGHEVARAHALRSSRPARPAGVARRRGRARCPPCTTSHPRRNRLPMSRETARSLPGIGREEQHDGVARADRDVAVLVDADHRQRGERLALAARDEEAASARRRGRGSTRRAASDDGGDAQQRPAPWPRPALSAMRRPTKPMERPGREGDVGHALDARDRGGEAGDEHAPARAREDVLEGGDDVVLAPGAARDARRSCCRRAGRARRGRPRRDSVSTSVRSSGPAPRVDLEVAAREHDAGRRLDGEGEAVEHAVRDADGVHAEGAESRRAAPGVSSAEVRARSPRSRSRRRAKPRVSRLP